MKNICFVVHLLGRKNSDGVLKAAIDIGILAFFKMKRIRIGFIHAFWVEFVVLVSIVNKCIWVKRKKIPYVIDVSYEYGSRRNKEGKKLYKFFGSKHNLIKNKRSNLEIHMSNDDVVGEILIRKLINYKNSKNLLLLLKG